MDQLSKESLNQIILLINNNALNEAEIKANKLLNKFPNSDIVQNLIGSIHVKNRKYEIRKSESVTLLFYIFFT